MKTGLMKLLTSAIILLFISIAYAPSITANNPISVKTIYVDDDNVDGPWDGSEEFPFQTIHDGVNASSDGDTVFVRSGSYQDYEIMILTSIDLIGEDKTTTIIEEGQIILLRGSISSISSLTMNHCSVISENQDYVEIFDNNIDGGIQIIDTLDAYVHNNNVSNTDGTEPGIKINGTGYTITKNRVTSGDCGIEIFGNNNLISDNIITDNRDDDNGYGIFLNGDSNTITNNHIANNIIGIRLHSAIDNKIERNNFIRNNNHVYFAGMLDELGQYKNKWDYNYWSGFILRWIFPKLIVGLGLIVIPGPGDLIFWIPFPLIQVDWHPANKPYDISIPEV